MWNEHNHFRWKYKIQRLFATWLQMNFHTICIRYYLIYIWNNNKKKQTR